MEHTSDMIPASNTKKFTNIGSIILNPSSPAPQPRGFFVSVDFLFENNSYQLILCKIHDIDQLADLIRFELRLICCLSTQRIH